MSDILIVQQTGADALSITEQKGDTVTITDAVRDVVVLSPGLSQGMKGDKGDPPDVSSYKREYITLTSGTLTIDCTHASTFFVELTMNVTSVVIANWPTGRSQRIAIYTQQDSVGGRSITGFPAGTKWAFGLDPVFTQTAGAIDCFVLDSFDGGQTIFGAVVGNNYA